VLTTDRAPAFPGGPLSQGIETDDFVFTVGVAWDDKAGRRSASADSVEEETRISLEAIGSVLAEAGCTLEDVVKTTVYLADRDYSEAMNRAYREFWVGGREPVRCTLFVGLAADCRVEIEAVAVKRAAATAR